MNDKLNELFSRNLKYWLSVNGKTQADLSRYMKVSSATASDWCNGRKIPRADKLQTICSWFGIKMSDLMEERTDKEPEDKEPGFEEALQVFTRSRKNLTREQRMELARKILEESDDE